MSYRITQVVFLWIRLEEQKMIMLSVLMVGEKLKMGLNIGLLEILGEVIGEKKAILDLLEVLTIWE